MNSITLLGSGDTLGTPLAGCNNPSCLDYDPKSKRFRFGMLLELGGKKILIDTNPDLKWQCLQNNFQLKDIDYILITHTHSDHVNGMGEFFYRRSSPIITYFLDHPLAHKHIEYFKYLEREEVLSFQTYQNFHTFTLDNSVTITPVELNHGFPCSGFVIEYQSRKIGIVSDTNSQLSSQTISTLHNCDYLFADAFSENTEQIAHVYQDCNIPSPDISKEWFHMTFSEAKQLQSTTQSNHLITVHMSRHISPHSDLVKKYQTKEFIVGYDGLQITLK